MSAIIFALMIGCGKKTEATSTSTSTEAETEQTTSINKDGAQIISVSNPGPKTGTGSIEINAFVPEEKTENKTKTDDEAELNTEASSDEKVED